MSLSILQRRPVLVLLDQAIVSGSTLLTLVLLGRFGGTSELGSYVLAFSILVLAGMVQTVLLTDPVVYSTRARTGLAGADGGVLQTLWLALAGLSVVVIGVAVHLVTGLEKLAPVLVLLAPMWMAREFARRLAMAFERFDWVLGMDFCISVLHMAGLVALLLGGALTAGNALAILGLANGVVLLTITSRGLRLLGRSGRPIREVAGEHWNMGRWLLAESGASYLDQYALHWLLLVVYGADATGLLAACLLPVAIASPLLQSAGNYLGPTITRALAVDGLSGMRSQVRTAALVLGTAGLGLTILAAVGGPPAVQALFPDMDIAGNAWLVVLAAGTIFWLCLEEIPSHALRALGQARLDLAATAIGVIVTVACGLLLVWGLGLAGVIVAMLAGGFVSAGARWVGLWFAVDSHLAHGRHPRPGRQGAGVSTVQASRALEGVSDRGSRPALGQRLPGTPLSKQGTP